MAAVMMMKNIMTSITTIISEQKDVKLSLRSPGLLAVDTDEEKDKER